MKELILEQKREFERSDDSLVPRDRLGEVGVHIDKPHALIISGLRRVGKSTLLKQVRERYYSKETCYYFNFEDERLSRFGAEDLNVLYETFLELFGGSGVFFLDEVQNVLGWESFVRRMYDRGNKFFITGSNSSMLSRELGTKLTGRYIGCELYPFSFGEFLEYRGTEVSKDLLTEDRAILKSRFSEYFETGGIPEYVRYGHPDILKTLYENILYRDVLVRYGLSDERTMLELANFLLSNQGSRISYNKLKNMLGTGSLNTIKNYIHYLQNSYLVFTIPMYSPSVRKQIYSKKKVYAIDTGLIRLVSFRSSRNLGHMLENVVFIELMRRDREVYYHMDRHECDFIVKEGNDIVECVQVTAGLGKNREREYGGLLEAMRTYGLDSGLILTEDEEFEESVDGIKVRVMPIWKWMLGLQE